MKILYGVQGTGNGHITRAIAMTEALSKYPDIDIHVLVSGRTPESICMPVTSISWRQGLTFVTEAGQVRMMKTVMQNSILRLARDIHELDLDSYDLVISDYEPVVSWSARLRRRNSIGIGHQYAFYSSVPMRGDDPLNRFVMRQLAPAGTRVGLHWHHFGAPILPPIVDIDKNLALELQQKQIENKVLVYLPFEDQEQVIALFRKLPDFDFYIYSPVLVDHDDGNIHRRKTSRTTFKADLATSSAVICNTGFELISECLALGIRVFTRPLAGQVEQLCNAAALCVLDYATVADRLWLPSIEKWLKSTRSVRVTYPNVQECLARWIALGTQETVEELADKTWRDVEVIHK